MKERYRKRRETAIIQLGGKCVKCGAKEELEFDHLDPKSKYKTISKLILAPDVILEAELNKCQLLCKNCHLEKSINEGSFEDVRLDIVCVRCNRLFKSRNAYHGHMIKCKDTLP